jgi:hypothetical protein
MKEKLAIQQNVYVSTSTIANALNGQLYTIKLLRFMPETMNNGVNKRKRKHYIQALNEFIRQGRQVVWLDETNFNLFVRMKSGRSKLGTRAVASLPAARGPNVHMIGAITANTIVKMETRRGSFTWQSANDWVSNLLLTWVATGFILFVYVDFSCYKLMFR